MKLPVPLPLQEAFSQALQSHDLLRCTRVLRQQAWLLLGSYLNGGIGPAGLLFPLLSGHSRSLRQQAGDFCSNWLQLQTVMQTGFGFNAKMQLPELLVQHYAVVSRLPEETSATQHLLVTRDRELYHTERVPRSFLRGNEPLNSLLHSFWVHGSSAEGEYREGWSDIDTLAIVSRDTLVSPSSLKKLRVHLLLMKAAMLKQHPIQLHGHFVLAEPDLAQLPLAFFPPVLLHRARLLPGYQGDPFVIQSYIDRDLALGMLWYHGVRDLLQHEKRPPETNMRRVAFLHRVYLLPCMILQARSLAVHKADLYAALARYFDAEDRAFLMRVSEIWQEWKPAMQARPWWASLVGANPVLAQRTLRGWVNSNVSYPAFERRDWAALTAEASRFAQKHWLEEWNSRD